MDQSTRPSKDPQPEPPPPYYPSKPAGMDWCLSRRKRRHQRSQDQKLEGFPTQLYGYVNCPKVWKAIRGLNNTSDNNSLNESMSHNGHTIANTKSKANILINHYAKVSKPYVTQEDPVINWPLEKTPPHSICQQWKLLLYQHVWGIVSSSEDETLGNCWPKRYSTSIP